MEIARIAVRQGRPVSAFERAFVAVFHGRKCEPLGRRPRAPSKCKVAGPEGRCFLHIAARLDRFPGIAEAVGEIRTSIRLCRDDPSVEPEIAGFPACGVMWRTLDEERGDVEGMDFTCGLPSVRPINRQTKSARKILKV